MAGLTVIVILTFLVILTIFLGVRIVPQGYKHVVQRLGKYHRTLNPGLNFVLPYLDAIAHKVITKDISMDIPTQEVITRDNAVIMTNALAFINVIDPQKAVYGVDDYRFAIVNLIQTSLRSIVGEMDLDDALSSREMIKSKLKAAISDDVSAWGIVVKTVEIQDIKPSPTMQQAMEKQASAERSRRAAITEAEGLKVAAILKAEGAKEAQIQEAEGKLEASRRDAEAKIIMAEASREAIKRVSDAIGERHLPAVYLLGERYVDAMKQLAASPNSKIIALPGEDSNKPIYPSIPSDSSIDFEIVFQDVHIPLGDPLSLDESNRTMARISDSRFQLTSPCLILGDNGQGKSLLAKILSGSISCEGRVKIDSGQGCSRARLLFQDMTTQILLRSFNQIVSSAKKAARLLLTAVYQEIIQTIIHRYEQAGRISPLESSNLPNAWCSLLELKTALAASRLLYHPAAIILDEPDWGLTRFASAAFVSSVISAAHQRRIPVILITHKPWWDAIAKSGFKTSRSPITQNRQGDREFLIALEKQFVRSNPSIILPGPYPQV